MSARVTRINLVGVAVVSALLILYAVSQLLQAFVLDRSYPLYAELPQASGLRENKEVTYNGHPIGKVDAVTAMPNGARIHMAIDNGVKVPTDIDVVVLRRSPIGEQAIDLRPTRHISDDVTLAAGEYYKAGATVKIRNLTLPPDVQELFETVVDVLKPVDPQTTGTLVSELADTVRGRKEDFRRILDDSADFSEAVADNGEDYDRLFRSSRVVNAELAEHRGDIAGLVTDLRLATSVLTDMRGEFERLLVEAPPVLTAIGEFVDEAQPNISCSIDYIGNLNAMTAQPKNLENAAEALRHNRLFFDGFEATTAHDFRNHNWFRVFMEPPHGPPPDSYLPDKRSIRPIRPGGACASPFGPGAPSATQAGFRQRVPNTRVIRPANDRTTSPRQSGDIGAGGGSAGTSTSRSAATQIVAGAPAAAAAAAVAPAGALPATGANSIVLLLGGLAATAIGEVLRRRSRRD